MDKENYDFKISLEKLREIIKKDPELGKKGIEYLLERKNDEFISSELYFLLARANVLLENFDESIKALNHSLLINEKENDLFDHLIDIKADDEIKRSLGSEREEEISIFEFVINKLNKDKRHFKTLFELSDIYHHKKHDLVKAEMCLQLAREFCYTFIGDIETEASEISKKLSDVYYSFGLFENAREEYKYFLELENNNEKNIYSNKTYLNLVIKSRNREEISYIFQTDKSQYDFEKKIYIDYIKILSETLALKKSDYQSHGMSRTLQDTKKLFQHDKKTKSEKILKHISFFQENCSSNNILETIKGIAHYHLGECEEAKDIWEKEREKIKMKKVIDRTKEDYETLLLSTYCLLGFEDSPKYSYKKIKNMAIANNKLLVSEINFLLNFVPIELMFRKEKKDLQKKYDRNKYINNEEINQEINKIAYAKLEEFL